MTLVRCHHLVDGSAIKPLYRWFESYPYEGYFILIISDIFKFLNYPCSERHPRRLRWEQEFLIDFR